MLLEGAMQIVVGARGTDEGGKEYSITRDEIHEFRKNHNLDIQDEHEIAKLVANVCFPCWMVNQEAFKTYTACTFAEIV